MTKEEVLKATLEFLMRNPKMQLGHIHDYIAGILRNRGEIGRISSPGNGGTWHRTVPFSDEDAMRVNEVVWDLITERILTPGVDAHDISLPWLSVTDSERLRRKFQAL